MNCVAHLLLYEVCLHFRDGIVQGSCLLVSVFRFHPGFRQCHACRSSSFVFCNTSNTACASNRQVSKRKSPNVSLGCVVKFHLVIFGHLKLLALTRVQTCTLFLTRLLFDMSAIPSVVPMSSYSAMLALLRDFPLAPLRP